MAEDPDGAPGANLLGEREPMSWRVRRWAAPGALALLVIASVVGVGLTVGGDTPAQGLYPGGRKPRFLLTAGGDGQRLARDGRTPWLQVRDVKAGTLRLAESVAPPPGAGEVREILAGPDGTVLVAAAQAEACRSRLYRFKLRADGHVTRIASLDGGDVPALVAGLAVSRDGRRIAYATAPCAKDEERRQEASHAVDPPRATLEVLDASGRRRAWEASGPAVIGEITWAGDGHTIGYSLADVGPRPLGGGTVGEVTVHALDVKAPGADLRAGRVLLRVPSGSDAVSSAIMNSDGRTGHGVMEKKQPPSTVTISFAEGRPMRVTRTFPHKPDDGMVSEGMVILFADTGEKRYACLNGIDAFGRLVSGTFEERSSGSGGCRTEWF
ncbi:esterase-like activity of phytase family protein [Actinomadura roseirufa]|uniref:esterase-like activity of phytase family protein n=1 Tax=Actinomadura roseirufa TaxID=2094049 RepID=UPI0013F15330|nr:esterase-like activity of phytase family protein [Actinomadura roseirufa]